MIEYEERKKREHEELEKTRNAIVQVLNIPDFEIKSLLNRCYGEKELTLFGYENEVVILLLNLAKHLKGKGIEIFIPTK